MTDLEKELKSFNEVWAGTFKHLRPLTIEEFEKEYIPNLKYSYYSQKEIANKYKKNVTSITRAS